MLKVKIFVEGTTDALERKINNFIKEESVGRKHPLELGEVGFTLLRNDNGVYVVMASYNEE